METTTIVVIVVIVILVLALLFFGYTVLKPNTSGTGTGQVTSYPQQQAIGGGCGR